MSTKKKAADTEHRCAMHSYNTMHYLTTTGDSLPAFIMHYAYVCDGRDIILWFH